MLNRTIAPAFKEITNINFVMPKKWNLSNNIPVYEYNFDSQNVIKIDFVFNAGTKYQHKPLLASTVNSLIKEGTKTYTSKQIADSIDFYGAFLETDISNDRAAVSLYCLTHHLDNVLPVLVDVILNAQFPQDELDNYLKRKKQAFLINLEKVGTLASQAYQKLIYKGTQYGSVAVIEDYDNITREECLAFHKELYNLNNLEIFIAGKSSDFMQQLLNEHLGNEKLNNNKIHFSFNELNYSPSKEFLFKEDAIQSAIRYGKPMFKINHPDFIPFQVLNTVLGGYFGSRLMSNIREDKGYTYGIGSGISSKQEMGNFVISTEVGKDVTEATLKEIDFEINRLKNDLIPDEELNVVKNYILGALLKNTDGPFDMLSRFQTIHYNNLPENHYDSFIEQVKNTSANKLRDLATEHLTDLTVIVAGSKNI